MRLEAPSPLEYFAALVAEDAHFPLLEAAALLGQDADPGLDAQAVMDQVDRLGQRFCSRLPPDAAPLHRLRMLNRYFFHELGFGGNANNFYDPQNSYLHRVLETRRGIPVSLAVLYVELATQARLPAMGVSFPGHFLVKLHLPAGEVLLDPLDGRSLSREELEERLEPFCQQRGLVGDDAVPLGLFLQAASPRDILARMLGNLKSIHRAAGDPVSGLAVQERLVRLLPQAWEEWRDRGLLLAELGQGQTAAEDLALYLREVPDAEDADRIRAQWQLLREQPPPRWH